MKIIMESNESKRKKQLLEKQLDHIKKQENKFLNKQENAFIKSKITPVVEKIEKNIPVKIKSTLDLAFYKGFQLVFLKGNAYIEKTYNKDKIQLEYDLNNYAIDKSMSSRYVKRMDKQSAYSKTLNSSIAVLEGSALGLLGIGIPDIPLFISVIVKTLNEIALSYGFLYDSEEERTYILYLICAAMTKEEQQREYDEKVEKLGRYLNLDIEVEINFDKDIRATSDILSDALLTAKFVQGIPFVGVIGGIVNHSIISKIAKYAGLKYKKRYLLKKLNE